MILFDFARTPNGVRVGRCRMHYRANRWTRHRMQHPRLPSPPALRAGFWVLSEDSRHSQRARHWQAVRSAGLGGRCWVRWHKWTRRGVRTPLGVRESVDGASNNDSHNLQRTRLLAGR